MKKTFKQKVIPNRNPLPSPRPWRRNSAYVFVACLGIWLPPAQAALLVDLDATQLPTGPLTNWINAASGIGDFTVPSGATVPAVTNVDGVKGVAFLATGGGAGGTSYIGPAAPSSVTGGNSRTIEAWVQNPSAQAEETVFGWGRRGGPDGTNCSFGHGTDPSFGAIGHWGAPDVGWNGNIVFNRWTYIVYTYDGTAATVYKDGEMANSENVTLNTFDVDNTAAAAPLPFRVA